MQGLSPAASHPLKECKGTAVQLASPTTTTVVKDTRARRGTHVVDVILRSSVRQTSHVDAVAGGALEGGRPVAVSVVRHSCREKSPF